ncbi:hypothetical protein G7Y79_00006g019030 [Physcia stellaris]|nr:hypothetical protein G7Y79_00006g019030 [Physcia stellaris]
MKGRIPRNTLKILNGRIGKTHSGKEQADSDKALQLLFRQKFENDAYTWYKDDVESDIKQNWAQLKDTFLSEYKITAENAPAKNFELRVKISQLKQEKRKSIAEYLKRVEELTRKMTKDEMDVNMVILRGMRDQPKRDQINFEHNKNADYDYKNVKELIKAAYSEIRKPDPFDPVYKDTAVTLLSHGTQTNEDLRRQVLINTNQAFPAILNGCRSLNMSANQNQLTIGGTSTSNTQAAKKDISQIKCFIY